MAGIIMDFEGKAVDTLSDAIVVVCDIVMAADEERALSFRGTWRLADPDHADDNIRWIIQRVWPQVPRAILRLFGVDPRPVEVIDERDLLPLEDIIQLGVTGFHAHAGIEP